MYFFYLKEIEDIHLIILLLVWSDTDQTHRIPMEAGEEVEVGPKRYRGPQGQTVRDTI